MTNPVILTLLVGVAGGLGAVLRWLIIRWNGALPFGLFAVNILAGGFLGLVYAADLAPGWVTILGIGFAGGLSTFATMSAEGFMYYHRGRIVQMLLTLAINVLMPVLALLLVLQFA